MEITEVRVKLVSGKNDKLRAFCSITIDNDFVIRDLKVIDGVKGPFVAMPSRKLMEKCSNCGGKNHYRARFCNDCGKQVRRSANRGRIELDAEEGDAGRSKLHTEIAHPINSSCREMIQRCVLEKYDEERKYASSPGYKPATYHQDDTEEQGYDDYFRDTDSVAGRPPRLGTPAHTESDPAPDPIAGDGVSERSVRGKEGLAPERSGPPKPSLDDPSLWKKKDRGGLSQQRGPERQEVQGPSEGRPEGEHQRAEPGEKQPPEGQEKRSGVGEEVETEPEDNFGAGIFP